MAQPKSTLGAQLANPVFLDTKIALRKKAIHVFFLTNTAEKSTKAVILVMVATGVHIQSTMTYRITNGIGAKSTIVLKLTRINATSYLIGE